MLSAWRARRRRPFRGRPAAVAVVLAVLVSACSASTDRRIVEGVLEAGDASFYALPPPSPTGQPGEIVRTEVLRSAPDGTIAWRVLYHSTDVFGADNIVSGVVISPASPPPPEGRVVVGWGHPTTGAAARCAPSNGVDPFDLIEGLRDLLDAGYVVAAADYPGLGVEGQSSYLIGASEGNSVLDLMRAAKALPGTGVGGDALLWGHSQGGQAVLFAAQAARAYAPELTVRGVAVAAPAAQLIALLDDDITDPSGVTIGSYAFAAYQSAYQARFPGLALDSVLTPEGAAATPGMAELCLFGQHTELHDTATRLVGNYLAHDPATTEPWATLLTENTPGAQPLGAPLFVAQGASDTLVVPSATAAFVSRMCSASEHVTFQSYPDTGHGGIALKALPAVLSFLSASLAGAPPPSTC